MLYIMWPPSDIGLLCSIVSPSFQGSIRYNMSNYHRYGSSYEYSSCPESEQYIDAHQSRRLGAPRNQHQSDIPWTVERIPRTLYRGDGGDVPSLNPSTPIRFPRNSSAFRPINRNENSEETSAETVVHSNRTGVRSEEKYDPCHQGAFLRPIPEPSVRPYVYSRPPNAVSTAPNRLMDTSARSRSPLPLTRAISLYGLCIRGAEETWEAIQQDFYEPCPCSHCETTIFSVADAAYVLCPLCQEVSPLDSVSTLSEAHGLGLGFTGDQLAQFQAKIASGG